MGELVDALRQRLLGGAAVRRGGGAARAAERVGRLGELVGDGDAGEEQEARLAELAELLRESGDLVVEIFRKAADALLLPVVARDLVAPSVDGDGDLRHQP